MVCSVSLSHSSLSRLTTPYSREASSSALIGYWKSHPKTPLATVCRDVWQWSRVTRVNSRAGTVFMPCAQTACQPIMKSQLRALLLLWMAEGQETTLAHFITVGSQWYTPVCSTVYSYENFCVLPTKQTLPPFYPSGLSSRDSSLLRVLRHWSHWTWLCLNTLHAKPGNGTAMCRFMVPWVKRCSRWLPKSTPKKT